ncbi:MAG: hypothetical protein ACP5I8_00670 [Phycisphaerae bacterium]
MMDARLAMQWQAAGIPWRGSGLAGWLNHAGLYRTRKSFALLDCAADGQGQLTADASSWIIAFS